MLNKIIASIIPIFPKKFIYIFAKKYIAGPTLDDAIRVTRELMAKGGMSTIDVLGEFVTTKEMVENELHACSTVLDAIIENHLDSNLSVKPTSLGLGIDPDYGYENIKTLLTKARSLGLFVRLDMENSPYTTATIELYKRLRKDGFDNVGIVLQAYMRRSMDDVKSLIEYKPNIRLCKGIYVEPKEIAYKDKEEIRENYRRLLTTMLDNDFYVGIATHDEPLILYAEELIKQKGLTREQYEFQMLLGVRNERRDQLLAEGHRLRVYVPFGTDWFGYSTRRLKENPKMVNDIIKSIFGMNK
ncbi:MAG TPA: proline dehydrogenase family protein [Bacteroidota bacterium]|nr:proline dehydrogenase family protein [Candidatus Kapabacteria bacterium]HRS01412.1 proline dehydrogenase family protein [Bacteroidota bacterium]HRT67926.1 proline dehydrogenase family protein [Bacteroidota bacterium]